MTRTPRFSSDVWIPASAVCMALALFVVFLVVPRESVMGDVQRVFYFHVSAAWTGYLALSVAFLTSLLFLLRRESRCDRLALSSVEVGLVFVTEGIVTGAIWSRATWGVWWIWEPRLTTSAVLWLMNCTYLTLRRSVEEESQAARLGAVYAMVGFAAVPINFMAIRWWRTVHPLVFESGGMNLAPPMLAALVLCVATYALLYLVMLRSRLRLEQQFREVRRLKTLQRGPNQVAVSREA